MSARKTQATDKTSPKAAMPAGDVPTLRDTASPSRLQRFLLAAAVVLEASWLAALATMALTE
ncbi:MAG: hypothetical protein U1E05_01830 [Patescibacteria group bacterium]|nr:hypothetical protein [Patescibacteria group bacterium]